MNEKSTSVKKDFAHLFSTPIDSMFAIIPFNFGN